MINAWSSVRQIVDGQDVTWRDAAYALALSRIGDAKETRGLWP